MTIEILFLGSYLILLPFIDRRTERLFGIISILVFCFKLSFLSTMGSLEENLIPFMFMAPFAVGFFEIYVRRCYKTKIFEGSKIKPNSFDIKKILEFSDTGEDSNELIEEFGKMGVHLELCKKANCGCRKLWEEVEIFN